MLKNKIDLTKKPFVNLSKKEINFISLKNINLKK
jgi:hypothetical protein